MQRSQIKTPKDNGSVTVSVKVAEDVHASVNLSELLAVGC